MTNSGLIGQSRAHSGLLARLPIQADARNLPSSPTKYAEIVDSSFMDESESLEHPAPAWPEVSRRKPPQDHRSLSTNTTEEKKKKKIP